MVPASGQDVPTVAETSAFLRERGVATQYFPEAVRACKDLPRTPSGKIQKFLLEQTPLELHQPAQARG